MNDSEQFERPHRGRDFLLGFFLTPVFVFLFVAFIGTKGTTEDIVLGVFLLLSAILVSVVEGHRHIAFGILAVAVGVPLLFFGTCYAIVTVGS